MSGNCAARAASTGKPCRNFVFGKTSFCAEHQDPANRAAGALAAEDPSVDPGDLDLWDDPDPRTKVDRLLATFGISNTGEATARQTTFKRLLGSFQAGNTPYLTGPVGVGKSEGAKSLAHALDAKMTFIQLASLQDATGITGTPALVETEDKQKAVVEYALTSWFVPLREDAKREARGETVQTTLLVFDEVGSNPEYDKALLQIVNEREVNGERLPDSCKILLMGNKTEHSEHVDPLPAALMNRVAHYKMPVTQASEWREYMLESSEDLGQYYEPWVELLAAFATEQAPGIIDPDSPVNRDLALSDSPFGSPRSMTNAAREAAVFSELNNDLLHSDSIQALRAHLGDRWGNDIFHHAKNLHLPDPATWLENPKKAVEGFQRGVDDAATQITLNRMTALLKKDPPEWVPEAEQKSWRKKRFDNAVAVCCNLADEGAASLAHRAVTTIVRGDFDKNGPMPVLSKATKTRLYESFSDLLNELNEMDKQSAAKSAANN